MKPAAASRFWAERTPRERRILGVGGGLLLLVLCWLLLIDPALQGRAQWKQALPALRADYAQMQALAQQAAAAPAPAAAAPPPDRAAVERSLAEHGMKAQSLNVGEDGVRIALVDVSFSALTDWMQQAQRDAQLVVAEAGITARDRLDRVDANLSLRRLP
ncbi:MAG: type II secretion system protein M [Burkholderiaceae bacterium]|nr:type II secretion system protein M [Burkholderiaceae bacterium]